MKPFAALLERLAFTHAPQARVALLHRHFATTPDPDRGHALALLTGASALPTIKPAALRTLAASRTDPELFALSLAYVGDLAETLALSWPATADAPPPLAHVVTSLLHASKTDLPALLASWLDAMDSTTRLALLKLTTARPRPAVPAPLARAALAALSQGRVAAEDIEEIWHAQHPPYEPLFAWLDARAPRPAPPAAAFRPLMLAHPIDSPVALDPRTLRAEWKSDGTRVQLVATAGQRRLYSRDAEDLSAAFPGLLAAINVDAALDGQLLAPPNLPAVIRLHDLLAENGEDLRLLKFDQRRHRLEAWFARTRPPNMDLSPLLPFTTTEDLAALHAAARAQGAAGLMLKHADSPYLAGRHPGLWWKWQRTPLRLDAVLMYAERGRADYTVGVRRDDGALVPIGKAQSDLPDTDLAFLDHWVADHTVQRFGPVREVEPTLVLEITFDAVQPSPRHKSGITLRRPRIARLRPDKPADEADRLETVLAVVRTKR